VSFWLDTGRYVPSDGMLSMVARLPA